MPISTDSRTAVYVARQPIVDHTGNAFGYELLYRTNADDVACTAEGDVASARVLSDALLNIGLDTLTAGRPAFVNFTRSLLVSDLGTLLSPSQTVIELREDITVDDEVVAACDRLRKKGYVLALDDFQPGSPAEALLPYAKYVKVDVLATPPDEWAPLAKRLLSLGVRLIAEKTETAEAVERAQAAGCTLFQGYFFCRPKIIGASAMPARAMVYLNLMAALASPDLTVSMLEDLIKRDVSLSYRVLRCVNSAAFGLRCEVHSIRQALVLLGVDHIRKWAMTWSLAGLNGGAPETVVVALLRSRSCELLAEASPDGDGTDGFFLLGLCSLLDAMIGRPLHEAIAGLPLPESIRSALLGDANLPRTVLDLVMAYERGDWEEAARLSSSAGIDPGILPAAYGNALRWARELPRQDS